MYKILFLQSVAFHFVDIDTQVNRKVQSTSRHFLNRGRGFVSKKTFVLPQLDGLNIRQRLVGDRILHAAIK